MKEALQIIKFMKIIEKLCLVKRDNLLSEGGSESDSDHIFKLTFWIMLIYPYLKSKVDYLKMLELALVHDIVEAQTGDFPLASQTAEIKALKKQKEYEAVEYYKSILPYPLNNKIYDLFIEYNERKTREAQIVWCMDKLDANYQSNLYEDGNIFYWGDCDNGEFYYKMALDMVTTPDREVIKNLDEDILTDIKSIIMQISQENIKKCGIEVEKTA